MTRNCVFPLILPFSIPRKNKPCKDTCKLSSWTLLPELNWPCQAVPALTSIPLWEAGMPQPTAPARGKLFQPCRGSLTYKQRALC